MSHLNGQERMDFATPKDRKSKVTISKEDVKNFRERCIYARALFIHHCRLFDSGSDISENFKSSCPTLFGDVCHAFREQIFLQVNTLTDPARDGRGNRNLTIKFFVENIDLESCRIKCLSNRLHSFATKIRPAQNKIISHFDHETSLSFDQPLGKADMKSWNQFWLDLQEFVYILSEKFLNEKIHINGVSNNSDIPTLISILRQDGERKQSPVRNAPVKM